MNQIFLTVLVAVVSYLLGCFSTGITISRLQGVDIRKPVFYAMSEKGWAIIGMEAVGMNLEEVFIKIMEKSAR